MHTGQHRVTLCKLRVFVIIQRANFRPSTTGIVVAVWTAADKVHVPVFQNLINNTVQKITYLYLVADSKSVGGFPCLLGGMIGPFVGIAFEGCLFQVDFCDFFSCTFLSHCDSP